MQQGKRAVDEPDSTASATGAAPARPKRPPSPLTVLGVLLLAAGLACLGWVGWQYIGTNIVSKQEAGKEINVLEESWTQPAGETSTAPGGPPPVTASEMGRAQWLLRVPAFGSDYVWPIVAGVEPGDLKKGVGWYPATAQPGQVGNFALAGHRITNGEPFRRMPELSVGDTIIIETRDAILTYELTSAPGQLTVQNTEAWVLDPVPGHDDVQPSEALITLTTCEDLFNSPDRSVAFGKLATTETK